MIQPLKLMLQPEYILKAIELLAASDISDSLHKRRRDSMLKLSHEGRLRAQSQQLPKAEDPLIVSIQASCLSTVESSKSLYPAFPNLLYFEYIWQQRGYCSLPLIVGETLFILYGCKCCAYI